MKDELINFEVAKSAKEKGLSISGSSYYNNEGKLKYFLEDDDAHDLIQINPEGIFSYGTFKSDFADSIFITCTQSSLASWLRDNHNLYIYITPTSHGDNAPFIKDPWDNTIYDPWKNKNKGIDYNYEGALNFILEKALSLIKN